MDKAKVKNFWSVRVNTEIWTIVPGQRRVCGGCMAIALVGILTECFSSGKASVCMMLLGNGLEFRAMVVMACGDAVIRLLQRVNSVGGESGLQEGYDTERHLLYLACTRDRDCCLITAAGPAAEFLDDRLS